MPRKFGPYFASPLFPLSALTLAFLLSLAIFVIFSPPLDGRVFFFPVNSGKTIDSERRAVPSRRYINQQITIFLEELFIGPVSLELAPTVPRGTVLRHVAVVDKIVYVDLGLRMLESDSELSVPFDTALENITYNLRFNFPRVEEIVFTIEGSQVGAPHY